VASEYQLADWHHLPRHTQGSVGGVDDTAHCVAVHSSASQLTRTERSARCYRRQTMLVQSNDVQGDGAFLVAALCECVWCERFGDAAEAEADHRHGRVEQRRAIGVVVSSVGCRPSHRVSIQLDSTLLCPNKQLRPVKPPLRVRMCDSGHLQIHILTFVMFLFCATTSLSRSHVHICNQYMDSIAVLVRGVLILSRFLITRSCSVA